MRVLVTGASGMLGRATAAALAERGDDVTVLQRRPAGLACREVLGDVADPAVVARAVDGQDAVLHLAAKVDVTGRWAEYLRANVEGTRTVVDACRRAGVGRLVHVSSPSVAHGGQALVGVGAGPADPARARGHYARSKAVAERDALAADSPSLAVLVVRPHLVWGPGDTQLVERIVERARAGRLPVIGSGAALIDTTYVDNAADALVAAVDACGRGATAGGRGDRPALRGGRRPRAAAAGAVPARLGGRRRRRGRVDGDLAARHSPADPVPRRAAGHRPLVRPAPHPRGAGLDAAGRPGRGLRPARRGLRGSLTPAQPNQGGATPQPQCGTGASRTTSAPGCELVSASRVPHST
jgi:nucleoside-diphosphate-sugar epimerase